MNLELRPLSSTFEAQIDEYFSGLSERTHASDFNHIDWVPDIFFELVKNQKLVGIVRIRDRLNNPLLIEGGNISYDILPGYRNNGYGYKALSLALLRCQKMGLNRVLITCNEDNIPSQKIIRQNGGKLDNKSISPRTGKTVLRFWINL